MRLVLDTNILIAALIKDSLTREIFFGPGFEFLLPEYAIGWPGGIVSHASGPTEEPKADNRRPRSAT